MKYVPHSCITSLKHYHGSLFQRICLCEAATIGGSYERGYATTDDVEKYLERYGYLGDDGSMNPHSWGEGLFMYAIRWDLERHKRMAQEQS